MRTSTNTGGLSLSGPSKPTNGIAAPSLVWACHVTWYSARRLSKSHQPRLHSGLKRSGREKYLPLYLFEQTCEVPAWASFKTYNRRFSAPLTTRTNNERARRQTCGSAGPDVYISRARHLGESFTRWPKKQITERFLVVAVSPDNTRFIQKQCPMPCLLQWGMLRGVILPSGRGEQPPPELSG